MRTPYTERLPELAVEAAGLQKSYGDVQVLRGVDLRVARGSVFALLGPNGAGKTTTVKILATLVSADGGRGRGGGGGGGRPRRAGGRGWPGSTWPPSAARSAAASRSPANTRRSTSCRRARRTCA